MTAAPPREPVRVQRRRTRGWRAPAGAVYVGRPTRWQNPLRIRRRTRMWAVTAPDGGIVAEARSRREEDVRAALAGRDLMCWCPPDLPCHADVLLEIANPQNGDHHDH